MEKDCFLNSSDSNAIPKDVDKKLFSDMIHFISKDFRISSESIKYYTRFESDLNIYGEDMFEFIVDYSKRYNVDLSLFDFRKYISREKRISIFSKLLTSIGIISKPKDLTVLDLYNGIIDGRLV